MLGCGREWGAGPRLSGVDAGPPFSAGTACSPSEAQLPHARVPACLLETGNIANTFPVEGTPQSSLQSPGSPPGAGHSSIGLAGTAVHRGTSAGRTVESQKGPPLG